MARVHGYLRWVDRLFEHGTVAAVDDGQSLERLLTQPDELALEMLIQRHGPLVLSVCRRLLKSQPDVDDAFQATFLILIRKAPFLRDHHRLGPWLCGVAYRVAMRARADRARRRELEQTRLQFQPAEPMTSPETLALRAELCDMVDQEIARLSEPHRAAIVLCDLEGRTVQDAALELGWSEGALRGRLARARRKLRDRLARRGVAPAVFAASSPKLGNALASHLPAGLVESTVGAAMATVLAERTAPTAATAISASVAALVKGVTRAMTVSKVTSIAGFVILVAAGLAAGAGLVRAGRATTGFGPARHRVAAERSQVDDRTGHEQGARAKTLEFEVERKSNKQPIAGVEIEVACYVHTAFTEMKAQTDQQGRSVVGLPEAASNVTVIFSKDGFVPTRRTWGENEPIPAPIREELEPGQPIGGFVKDLRGRPISAARVTVALRRQQRNEPDLDLPAGGDVSFGGALPSLTVATDAQGRWHCSILPADAEMGTRLWFYLEHPDYVSDTGHYSRRLSLKTARAMTGVLLMKKGLTVTGVVHDGKRRFVSGAKVTLGYSPSAGNFIRTTTDAAGRFTFRNADDRSGLGRWSVSVEAAGYAPAWQMIAPHEGIPPLEFSLSPSQPFRGQVVDNQQAPVAGALVEAQWQECYFLDWKARTDAEGRFIWLDGPADGEIVFNVRKENFTVAMRRRAAAKEGKITVTINPRIRVRGTVIDAETGKPIPKFEVVAGETNGNSRIFWRSGTGKSATNGQFDVTPFYYDQPGIAFFIRTVAQGYRPADSRAISPGESDVALDFKLKKGTGPFGVVKLQDGSPAIGADVYLNDPRKYGLPLENNRQQFLSPGPDQFWVKTDQEGRFHFEAKDEPLGVLVLHVKGVAQKSASELEKSNTLVLEPFGRIEGTLRIGSELGVRQPIRVRLDRSAYLPEWYQFFHYTTETDDRGQFVIENVMPGEATVSRSLSRSPTGQIALNSVAAVDIAPGQTVNVAIGGEGRPVVGRVKVPSGTATKLDFATASASLSVKRAQMPQPDGFMSWDQQQRYAYSRRWYLSAEGKAGRRAARSYAIAVASDGAFRVDDVLPGKYELTIEVQDVLGFWGRTAAGAHTRASAQRPVEIEPIPGGQSDEPLDLGTIKLDVEIEGQRNLAVGEMAPAFDVKTLDGKPLRLTDFRGKFVLLDFWATWCGPCIEQEPFLKAAFDAFQHDNRFVFISLSLDDKPEIPRDYVAKHGLKWIQGFLGRGSSVTASYGIASIPAIMLIGPDGKLIAQDLGGPGIKTSLGQALETRP
jgi:RNA polymerase sigma factor (sigma-70 family)